MHNPKQQLLQPKFFSGKTILSLSTISSKTHILIKDMLSPYPATAYEAEHDGTMDTKFSW